ncbi:hypothetical protein SmJEL517_g01794 [Synchytrium microbalum]|uniref:Glutaredoxin-like protein n=1 Tax=Synchytrium microbalum TaxID=1806994 RepID=A0A507C8Q0_9FUNG|nr:uncharacterized protein SmJEL517_g01794 [Synchytrium microbalum]TPX36002.1 hypothetical protein SmJEL517_g01794 [Synchytrium microbalum]
MASTRRIVTLFTKAGQCSLCDDAKEALQRVQKRVVFQVKEVDILQNPSWKRLYQYDIPVIHVDDKLVQKHRVDEEKLYKILTN